MNFSPLNSTIHLFPILFFQKRLIVAWGIFDNQSGKVSDSGIRFRFLSDLELIERVFKFNLIACLSSPRRISYLLPEWDEIWSRLCICEGLI